jgi:mannosyl-3-phosphoglycerate phosphatase
MTAVVYSDLDGTLLDHHDYSFEKALPAINLLKHLSIPIIPVTSKTRAELEPLRDQLEINTPFIVENGAAVFIPKSFPMDFSTNELEDVDGYWVKSFSPNSLYWSSVMDELSDKFPNCFQSFSQMNIENVVELTGLTHFQASLASKREYSDPIYWFGNDAQYDALSEYCQHLEIEVVKGGRFVHLLKGADKGKALAWFQKFLQASESETIQSIALGDGENDLAMLQQADVAVQIRSPNHDFPVYFPLTNEQRLIQTQEEGPAGWNESIHMIFKEHT